jgi:hypothetical protein
MQNRARKTPAPTGERTAAPRLLRAIKGGVSASTSIAEVKGPLRRLTAAGADDVAMRAIKAATERFETERAKNREKLASLRAARLKELGAMPAPMLGAKPHPLVAVPRAASPPIARAPAPPAEAKRRFPEEWGLTKGEQFFLSLLLERSWPSKLALLHAYHQGGYHASDDKIVDVLFSRVRMKLREHGIVVPRRHKCGDGAIARLALP